MNFLDRPNLENPHKTPTSQAKPGANTKGIRRQYRVKLDPKITTVLAGKTYKINETYQTCTP